VPRLAIRMEHSVPERQIRVDKSDRTAETISFDGGKSISSWEDYIPGNFFLSSDRSGSDYFKKKTTPSCPGTAW